MNEPKEPTTMIPEPEPELVERDEDEKRRRQGKWDPNLGASIGEIPDFERSRRPAKPERMS